MTEVNYANDRVPLSKTIAQAESQLQSLEKTLASM